MSKEPTAEQIRNRAIVAAEVNHPDTKVSIDKSCFAKNSQEKLALKEAKKLYKKTLFAE
jgi:hypothetical protein